MVLHLGSGENWESWVEDIYSKKFETMLKAEAEISSLTNEFFTKSEHNLLYKQEKSLSDEQMKYMKGLYGHLSGVLQEIESILFLAWE